jgi:adenylate cyclase
MKMAKPLPRLLLVMGLVAVAVLLRVLDPEPVARLRLMVFDAYQQLLPRAADPAHPVRIVDIDTASLERVGQWPWPRTRLAQIIERLRQAGARVVAVDIVLAEADRLSPNEFVRLFSDQPGLARLAEEAARLPSNDERLAAAIATMPVVLGFVAEDAPANSGPGGLSAPRASFAFAGDDAHLFAPSYPTATGSLPSLSEHAAGFGSVNWLPSSDQIVRRVPLLISVAGRLYPSLALEAARVGLGESTLLVQSSGGSGVLAFGHRTGIEKLRVGRRVLPTEADGEMWLYFANSDQGLFVSAYRILEGAFDRADVAGRYVLIGSSAPGLLDLRATPLESAVPGVAVHAQALEQILSGTTLSRPSFAAGAEILFLVGVCALVAWLMQRRGPILAALTAAGAVLLVAALSWLAYRRYGLLFDPVFPSLSIVALYLAVSLGTYVNAEVERRYVRAAFSHYLAAPLVEELARNRQNLKLGGEMREVTVLFADVRQFSRMAEGRDAEELIRFVNEIFTPLSDIILANLGTIDKFMGDAVMAFWNAPIVDPKHARHACTAALRMIEVLDEFNRLCAAKAAARGERAMPVRIGIGLNTGECCVGNVGSPQRFDYSILGDVVNVASRLEEATKIYGVPIIVGEKTAAAAAEMALLEIDSIPLRGMARPERIFALLGDEALARSQRFLTLKAAMAGLAEALKAHDEAAARARFAECRALAWPRLDRLLELRSAAR